jgi:hypothetical protein
MGKGFGIAALIVALIAIFVPFYGIFFSALAIVLAVVAALATDRMFATAVPLIAGVNTFLLSPSTWFMMLSAADQKGISSQGLTAIIWAFLSAPFIAMALDSMMRGSRTATPISGMQVQSNATNLPAATGDAGEDTWRMIANMNDRALLEEFINRFPDHPRALMARVALKQMGDGSIPPPLPVPETAANPRNSGGKLPTSNGPAIAGIVFLAGTVLGIVYLQQRHAEENVRVERIRAEEQQEQARKQKDEQKERERVAEEARQKTIRDKEADEARRLANEKWEVDREQREREAKRLQAEEEENERIRSESKSTAGSNIYKKEEDNGGEPWTFDEEDEQLKRQAVMLWWNNLCRSRGEMAINRTEGWGCTGGE